MPGNEVGDRVHNFFGQENLSPGQHHTQSIEGNWQGLSDNLWVGGQRQIGGPFISSLKNYNLQQPDAERGHASQPSHMPHGLNFTQSNLKHEFGRVQTQNQQPAPNGYLHGNQVFQGRQNETNFLGVDADANRHNLGGSGLSMSHQGNAPENSKKNSMRLDASESPVSFDFFGGQQQMSGQHLNVLQSMPRQQSGNNDVQLLQRQMMLQQLQEFQRQQQLQQFDPKQQGFMNQVSSVVKHTAGNHSPSLINGVPISEASNNMWQPELMAGGTNWMHRGASPVIHGLSSGHMFPPEQGQALRLMEMVPQQGDQSLYGVPISSTNGPPGPYSHIQMDKTGMQQITPNNNALSASAYGSFQDQVSMQEETIQDFQGKNMFGPASGQGIGSGFNMENLQQVNHQQRSSPAQEFQGRQEVAESSEPPQENFFNQASSSQNAATLDPTEEKILFGSDDNIWDAFGKSTNLGMGGYDMMDGADYSSGCPLQSGSWSALMQSAVAEASSGDTGIQEEWCGPSVQNSEGSTGNQQSSISHGGKLQGVWANNNFQPSITASSWPSSVPVDPSRPNPSISSFGHPQFQQSEYKGSQVQGDLLHSDSSQRSIPKFSEPASKWSERGPPSKHSVEGRPGYTNSGHPSGAEPNTNSNSGSWNRLEGIPTNNSSTQPYNRPNGWNFIDSGQADGGESFRTPENKNSVQPTQSGDRKRGIHDELGNAGMWRDDSSSNSNAELEPTKSSIGGTRVARNASSLNNIAGANSSSVRLSQEGKKLLPNSHKHDFWKVVDPSMHSKGAEVLGRNKQSLDKSPQILETGNPGSERGAETTGIDSINKNYSAEGFQPNVLHHSSGGGSKENSWSDAGESRMFPGGGKQKSAANVGRKPPGTRKFQYHPMGDVDVDNDPSYGAKPTKNSQTLPHQMSRGLKGYDQGSSGQPMFGSHVDKTSLESEKENSSASQADAKSLDATSSKSMFPRFAPNSSSPFDRGINNFASHKVPPSSQHMLELLHKVDHQREHSTTPHMSSSERNLSAEMHETETSDGSVGHVQRNQSSSSQSFGLQLAPPSQCLPSGDHAVSSQSSQKVVYDSNHAMQEAGEKGQIYQPSKAPAVSFAPSYEPSQRHGHNNATGSAQIGNRAPYSNIQGTTLPSGFTYGRNLENQQMYAATGQIMANQSIHIPFNRISSGSKQFDGSSERAHANHFAQPPMQDLAASAPPDNLASSAETSQPIRTDQANKQEIAQQITESEKTQVAQLSGHQAAFSKMSPNAWNGIPCEQSSLVGQPLKVGLLESQRQPSNSLVTFPGAPKLNEQHILEGRNDMSGTGVFQANSQNFTVKEQPDREVPRQQIPPDNVEAAAKASYVSQGTESVAKNFSEASLASHAATQRDIEAFGRSLRPNNSLQHNYSLLHQVQSMKSTDTEPGDRSTKRLRGPDHVMDHQQADPYLGGQQSTFAYNGVGRDGTASNASAPGDTKMLTFSSKPAESRESNVSSQDAVSIAQNSSNNITSSSGNTPSTRSEHQQINIRMAPLWFDQYGSFKKGQMMQVYDLQKASIMKSVEPNFVVGSVTDGLHSRDPSESGHVAAEGNQLGILQQVSLPKSTLSEDLTSPPLVPQSSDQTLAVERPKKRKSETSDLVAWNKELTSTVRRLQTISLAEVEWAKVTNRVAEKVEESETMDEAMPIYRPRRRLVLTTQLMQQLLQPPSLAVLSSDASSQHEALVYFSARLALGDGCSASSCSETEDKSTSSENLKTPRAIDQYSSKVEDFINRARRLESELLRLDKRASILDLRVECQDLEKFSVINRFAKFHSRGQADGAEASSTDGTTLNAPKPGPQKYVTALPMPRNPPDRVQCLSL